MKFEEAAVNRIPAVQRDPHQQTVSSFAEQEVQGNRQKLSVTVRWLFIEPLLGATVSATRCFVEQLSWFDRKDGVFSCFVKQLSWFDRKDGVFSCFAREWMFVCVVNQWMILCADMNECCLRRIECQIEWMLVCVKMNVSSYAS